MNTRWYCRIGTQVQGPLEFELLKDLVAQGKLGADDEVRTSRSYEWSRAETVPDLFPPHADADDLLEMLSNHAPGPTRSRRRAKRLSLCYVRVGDDVRGPLPFEELGQLARSGALDRRDQVRMSAEAKWMDAGSIVGLFESQIPPAASRQVAEIQPAVRRASNLASEQRASPAGIDDPDRTWYWESAQRGTTGPLTFEQVFALAQNGRIEPTDKVRAGLLHPWVNAESIVGLFPDSDAAPIRVPTVTARRESSTPATQQPVAPATASAKRAPLRQAAPSKPGPVASTIAPARRAVTPPPRATPQPPSPAPVAAPRAVPPPAAVAAAPPRPAPAPKPVPRAAPPVFAPVRRRRTVDIGALFAGMKFNFGAPHAAVLAVVVVGGLLWTFGMPSFSPGTGGSGGPTAEAQGICQELIVLRDQDVIAEKDWVGFKERTLPRIKELATVLEQEGDDSQTQAMLRCCREYLPAILEAGVTKRPPEWDKMVDALKTT